MKDKVKRTISAAICNVCTCNLFILMEGLTEVLCNLLWCLLYLLANATDTGPGWPWQWSTQNPFFLSCHQIILKTCCLWIDLDFYILFYFVSSIFLSSPCEFEKCNRNKTPNVTFQVPNEWMNEWERKCIFFLIVWLSRSATWLLMFSWIIAIRFNSLP